MFFVPFVIFSKSPACRFLCPVCVFVPNAFLILSQQQFASFVPFFFFCPTVFFCPGTRRVFHAGPCAQHAKTKNGQPDWVEKVERKRSFEKLEEKVGKIRKLFSFLPDFLS